jgi:hypothetical protein
MLAGILGATLLLALSAAVLQRTVFRYGSIDLDDLDYRNQAAALAQGETTLSAASHSPSFLPYLTGIHDGRIVFTHQPLWAGYLAVFEVLHVPLEFAVALNAVLCAMAAIALVRELIDDRTAGVVATVLVIVSPAILVQSGTILGYLPTLTLGMAATALMLRSIRTVSGRSALAGGFVAGLAVFNRPFDAVLFLLPVGIYGLTRMRSAAVRALIPWILVGAVAPLGLMLVYNWSVMGSLFRFPYAVHPQDTIGFGSRASFGPSGFHFGLSQAWSGLVDNLHQVLRWSVGGICGIVLAGVGLVTARRRVKVWIVASWIVLFPLGYFFFWTSWNVAGFGLITPLGPFYYLGSLVGLAILAGVGIASIARAVPTVAILAVLVMIGLSARTLSDSWTENRQVRSTRVESQAVLDQARLTPRLVLTQPAFAEDPYVHQQNPPNLGGPVLYALSPSLPGIMQLSHRYSNYHLYEVANIHSPNGLFLPPEAVLRRLSVRSGRQFSFGLVLRLPERQADVPVTAFVSIAGTNEQISIPLSPSTSYSSECVVTASEISIDGQELPLPKHKSVQLDDGMSLGGNGSLGQGFYEYRYAVQPNHGSVDVLSPGQPWREYVFPGGKVAKDEEDLDGVLSASIQAGPSVG